MVQVTSLLAIVAASQLVHSHFLLDYPATVGFDDDKEGTVPCGSFTPDFTKNVTAFHVGGDTIALTTIHATTEWLFRATLDKTAGSNWTDLLPIVAQAGLGSFCERNVKAPSSWAGQQGVIQVISNAIDGFLFQCAAVNFTAGTAASIPASCKNASGITANFVVDSFFNLSFPSATFNATSTSSSSNASATAKASAGSTYGSHDALGALMWVAMAAIGVATALINL